MRENKLAVGTDIIDITPPLEVGLLTSSVEGSFAPFQSLRLPLKARLLALQSSGEALILISLDLLGLNDTVVGGWEYFKKELSDKVPPERIIITCTHTHNAPESLAFSALYHKESFKSWFQCIKEKLKIAIKNLLSQCEPATIDFTSSSINGYSLQRRIPTKDGIMMSDTMQPISPELLDREPIDRRVRVLRIKNATGEVLSTLVHATCHPVNEMCLPQISSDFPGELCSALKLSGEAGMAMFLNGAAGNINPPTVSEGAGAAHRHGIAIAEAVKQSYPSESLAPMCIFRHTELKIPVRQGYQLFNPGDATARISVLVLGDLALVFLPGEPFLETALYIEAESPFVHTLIVGYSENYIGYIPTKAAIQEGGYEAGPGSWSYLSSEADNILTKNALHLLHLIKSQLI
jgi:hypothetical protein